MSAVRWSTPGWWLFALQLAVACLPENPVGANSTSSASGGGDPGDDTAEDVLGCDQPQCTFLLVSQTLDDRVEIFAPDDAGGQVYRGALDLDLKPNECPGCGLGDYSAGRLDEPFGLSVAGGFVHVIAGHYPSPESGSIVSFPAASLATVSDGSTLSTSEYFSAGSFAPPVLGTPLEHLEPIFLTAVGSRLLVGTFNNNLFGAEETWTNPGRLLILDAADPSGDIGVVDLGLLPEGPCNGAAQIVEIAPGTIAVACDGNEGAAVLDVSALQAGSPSEAAATVTGALCSIPATGASRRVRHLAPDGEGGFLLAEGPSVLDLLSGARLWHLGADCTTLGTVALGGSGDGLLGEVVAIPGERSRWLLASGSVAQASDHRGLYVVQQTSDALEVCGPVVGSADPLTDDVGEPLQPFALAINAAADRLALGAGPFAPPTSGPGFGKVLWGTLTYAADDPCATSVALEDLAGGEDAAPAVDAADPKTFRRAPSVVEIVEVSG